MSGNPLKIGDDMKTRDLVFYLCIFILASGCAPQIFNYSPKPVDTKTDIPTMISTITQAPTTTTEATRTRTPKPTNTLTPIPSLTPNLNYTKIGLWTNKVANLLGWTIVLCDEQVDPYANFLYSTNPNKYFCDFEGHVAEPVPNICLNTRLF